MPGSPERACGRQTAKPSAPVCISRILYAQMRPAVAFRARSRSGDASEMSCTVDVSVDVSVWNVVWRVDDVEGPPIRSAPLGVWRRLQDQYIYAHHAPAGGGRFQGGTQHLKRLYH